MLSINQKKLIRSLQHKKYRDLHGLFVLEGDKIISDLLNAGMLGSEHAKLNCATADWIRKKSSEIGPLPLSSFLEAEHEEIKKLSSMQTAPEVFSVLHKPVHHYHPELLKTGTSLVFEAIRDPGNLGSIIRTADWFGMKNIFCSKDSVDAFNPKVVQSSMGAVLRINIYYLDLEELFLDAKRRKIPIYGTTMNGSNLYDTGIKKPGLLVFGNESSGISQQLNDFFSTTIRIPDFPPDGSATESLNIAASVAILCAELRRREY